VTSAAVAWAGFAGAWLLVAGPIYQAAIELEAEEIERDAIRDAAQAVPGPPPNSRWWWLIPRSAMPSGCAAAGRSGAT